MKVKIYTYFLVLTFLLPVGVMLGLSMTNDVEDVCITQSFSEEETEGHGSVELDGFNDGIHPLRPQSILQTEVVAELLEREFERDWNAVKPGSITPPPEI